MDLNKDNLRNEEIKAAREAMAKVQDKDEYESTLKKYNAAIAVLKQFKDQGKLTEAGEKDLKTLSQMAIEYAEIVEECKRRK